MKQFEIYTHKFELEGETYYLKPVGGDHLELLFRILTHFGEGDISVKDIEPAVMKDIHTLCLATFKKSYPQQKEEDLDAWLAQNLFKVFGDVIKVNMKQE
jgi:hypothetical protein